MKTIIFIKSNLSIFLLYLVLCYIINHFLSFRLLKYSLLIIYDPSQINTGIYHELEVKVQFSPKIYPVVPARLENTIISRALHRVLRRALPWPKNNEPWTNAALVLPNRYLKERSKRAKFHPSKLILSWKKTLVFFVFQEYKNTQRLIMGIQSKIKRNAKKQENWNHDAEKNQ